MNALRQFWSNVFAVAYKEAVMVRHDQALLATLTAQPIIMLLLFGAAISNKPANVPWLVLDRSQTTLSRQLVEEIEHTGYFLAPRYVESYDQGQALMKKGEGLAFLVIPSEFRREAERSVPQVQLLLDGSDPLSASRVGAYITQVAGALDVKGTAARLLPNEPVDVRHRFWFNPTLADRTFFLAGLAGMLLTNLCLSATSLGIVGERENGTYEQMLSLPTTPIQLLLGKLVPYVGLSYFLLALSTLLSGVVFGYWPRGSFITLIIITLPFVLASLSIGVLVSTLASTSAQAVFITVFFILPSFVLSGSMFPYQLMPDGVRQVGGLLPLRWYQIALRRVGERGAGLSEVLGPMAILTLLFAVFIGLAASRMKPRLE